MAISVKCYRQDKEVSGKTLKGTKMVIVCPNFPIKVISAFHCLSAILQPSNLQKTVNAEDSCPQKCKSVVSDNAIDHRPSY